MVHEIAKILLEQAGPFLERTEAVRTALYLGMPLNEIEEYLDWLDQVRPAIGADDDTSPPDDDGGAAPPERGNTASPDDGGGPDAV